MQWESLGLKEVLELYVRLFYLFSDKMRLYNPSFLLSSYFSFSCCGNSDALMSVIEGFVYDPLIDNSMKGNEREETYRRSTGTTRRIMSHLRGTISDTVNAGKALSVASQVNTTIAKASSEANLSQMFVGWAPWE